MTSDDAAALIHQHRIGPTPLLDCGCDFSDLRRRVRTGIAGIGYQLGNSATFDAISRLGSNIRIGLHNASSLPLLLNGCKIDIIAQNYSVFRRLSVFHRGPTNSLTILGAIEMGLPKDSDCFSAHTSREYPDRTRRPSLAKMLKSSEALPRKRAAGR